MVNGPRLLIHGGFPQALGTCRYSRQSLCCNRQQEWRTQDEPLDQSAIKGLLLYTPRFPGARYIMGAFSELTLSGTWGRVVMMAKGHAPATRCTVFPASGLGSHAVVYDTGLNLRIHSHSGPTLTHQRSY